MKNHVKNLEEFVSERENPKEPVATTKTVANSNDEIVKLQVQDPVQAFGVWNQTFGDTNSPSGWADPIIAQAAIYGMTPQEYIAYYGSQNSGDPGA